MKKKEKNSKSKKKFDYLLKFELFANLLITFQHYYNAKSIFLTYLT